MPIAVEERGTGAEAPGGAPQPPEAVFLRTVEVLLLHVASKGSAN